MSNEHPIIGKTYEIWDGMILRGIATYCDDPHHGPSFIDHSTSPPTVFMAVDFDQIKLIEQ